MVTFLKDQFKDFGKKSKVNKRFLHERSHMALEFPQSNGRVIRTFIPFLENPQINEIGRANLNNYELIGRAGELFAYAGAKSRRIKVVFNITLLHVMEMDIKEGIRDMFRRQFNLFFTDRERSKELFDLRRESKEEAKAIRESIESYSKSFGRNASISEETRVRLQEAEDEVAANDFLGNEDQKINEVGQQYALTHRNYYRKLIGKITNAQLAQQEADSVVTSIANDFGLELEQRSSRVTDLDKYLDLIYVWVNLIRASVLNNSRNTLYGPPVIRLTHGAMYNNVPCLMEDYNIRILDEVGYELETLTPKRIEVSLSLVESRTGNFGSYVAGQIESGDNLTGWESIISNNDLDPQNGLIGRENFSVT
jgi:hypothetical protein